MDDIRQESNTALKRGRRIRAALAAGGLLALSVAVAGCGSGRATPGVAATGSTPAGSISPSGGGRTSAMGLLAYAVCMRLHGVPSFPIPRAAVGSRKPPS